MCLPLFVSILQSPYGAVQTLGDTDPKALFTYLLTELNKRNLAYVHLIEPRGFHRQSKIQQPQDVTRIFREAYNVRSPMIVCVRKLFMAGARRMHTCCFDGRCSRI